MDALNWSKVTVKSFILLQNIMFLKKLFFLNLLFTKEKKVSQFPLKQHNCFQLW